MIIVHDAELSEDEDASLLDSTARVAVSGDYEVIPYTQFLEVAKPEDLIVLCGAEAAGKLLDRKVKITAEAGRTAEIEFTDGQKFEAVLQLSPGYIRRMNSLKGGRSEKATRLWMDIWEQIARVVEGVKIEPPEIRRIYNQHEAIALIRKLMTHKGTIAYDYETWGDVSALRPELCNLFKIVSIGVAWKEKGVTQAASFLFDRQPNLSPELVKVWKEFIRKPGRLAHFARYEHKCNLKRFGYTAPLKDTLLKLHALDELADGKLPRLMVRCGLHWGDFKIKYEQTRIDPMEAEVDDLLNYNGLDAYATLDCGDILDGWLDAEDRLPEIAEQDETFSYFLAHQEMAGLHVDEGQTAFMRAKIGQDARKIMADLRKMPEIKRVEKWAKDNIKSMAKVGEVMFNPRSHPMMQRLVLKELKLDPPKVRKQGKETQPLDNDALEPFVHAYPVLAKLNAYRSALAMEVFLNKWGAFIGATGCVHTSYSQTIVVTNRLSSTDPPLQNIPKDHEIRSVFTSRFENGWMINADFAQQEPRLIAGLSGDEKLSSALLAGKDMHTYVASQIFDIPYESISKESRERDLGKRMNLGIGYGQTEYGLAKKARISLDKAIGMLKKYFAEFTGVDAWMQGQHKHAMEFGYVCDHFGARRHLPAAQSTNEWERKRAFRQAGNAPIQMSAYRFTQISMCTLIQMVHDAEEAGEIPKGYIVPCGQVHDSLVVDSHPDVVEIALYMVNEAMTVHNHMPYWKDSGIPMKADLKIGRNLYEMSAVAA